MSMTSWRRPASQALNADWGWGQWPIRAALALLSVFLVAATPSLAQAPAPSLAPPAEQQPAAPPAATPPATAPPGAAAVPQPTLPDDVSARLSQLASRMDTVEKTVERVKDREQELAGQRGEIEVILYDAQALSDSLRPRLASVQSLIQKLGPLPGKDKSAEPPAIAAERARLDTQAGLYDGAIKTAELIEARARQLVTRIQELRYAVFTRNLMQQQASPLRPALWHELIGDIPPVTRQISFLSGWWWQGTRDKIWELLALLVATPLLYWWLDRISSRLVIPNGAPRTTPPSFLRRSFALLRNWPLLAMPMAATGILLFSLLDAIDVLSAPADRVALAVLKGVLLFAAVSALVRCLLSPRDGAWRVIPLADESAQRLARYVSWGAAVAAIDLSAAEIGRTLFLPVSFTVTQTLIASIAFVSVLIAILLTPLVPAGAVDAEGNPLPTSRHSPHWLKLPLWAMAIAIVAAALLGYVALARFAAHQVVLTGLVAIVIWLVHLAIKALAAEPAGDNRAVGSVLEERLGLDAARRGQIASLTALVLNVVLATVAVPLLLLQWGFSGSDILDWVKAAVFGFEIGQFKISLARILLAIALFTVLLFATRLAQGWLGRNVLTPSRMDPGIANSVHTAIGYVGVGLSLLIALGYGGLDITNLAIVAGALSVGIGFGLQSIVNNFVSGLILLVERPIKVGDWIVVKGSEGTVKRISVRSTEIETFDRASIIVPNSELITSAVTNWTHRNLLGRAMVKISVVPEAEPDVVFQLMLDAARAHPLVLREPAPVATLDALGKTALEFTVRATVSDVTKASSVASDIRIAILRALRASAIELAAPPAATAAA